MKLLFLVRNFRQGWGGVPEAARMMACQLHSIGVTSDVFDSGVMHESIEKMPALPLDHSRALPWCGSLDHYAAVIQMGPWQDALALRRLLATRCARPVYYFPSGGLAKIEFSQIADLKKYPYFSAVERPFLKHSSAIIFTSETERQATIPAARHCAPELVLPYLIEPVPFRVDRPGGSPGQICFAFLAEISPRKGLLELVEAFTAWTSGGGRGRDVRLVIGGAARSGHGSYMEKVRARLKRYPEVDVQFVGGVPHGERAAFYRAADVIVVPSRFESFGLTVVEGLQHGCHALASPHVGALEFLAPSDFVVRADGSAATDLEAGLERACRAFEARGAPARRECAAFGAKAVASMNARAGVAWEGLLPA